MKWVIERYRCCLPGAGLLLLATLLGPGGGSCAGRSGEGWWSRDTLGCGPRIRRELDASQQKSPLLAQPYRSLRPRHTLHLVNVAMVTATTSLNDVVAAEALLLSPTYTVITQCKQ